MASEITKFTAQAFHQAYEPFDRSEQVQSRADLYDKEQVVPYVGKLVHVIDEHAIYVCSSAPSRLTAVSWRPVLADNGTALYLSTEAGETFKVYVERDGVNTGRIMVDYPATINHPTA